MEVLSDILRSMRVRGSVYFCDSLDPPWSMAFQETGRASFHLVRRGECWIRSGKFTERLAPGDLVFIEPGLDHVLTSHAADQTAAPGISRTLLLCGYCKFSEEIPTPLMDVFPSLIVVREEEILKHLWLKRTLDQLSAEYMSDEPGSELVVDKLTEIVLVELIRINFGRRDQNHIVTALSDKRIGKSLQQIHTSPGIAWTLEMMAKEVGMSRAAFARRFKELVGQPMFEYLTALRVQRAKELLRDTSLPLYEIAGRVGYESDMAFTKMFKKFVGTTPTRYRKQRGEDRR